MADGRRFGAFVAKIAGLLAHTRGAIFGRKAQLCRSTQSGIKGGLFLQIVNWVGWASATGSEVPPGYE